MVNRVRGAPINKLLMFRDMYCNYASYRTYILDDEIVALLFDDPVISTKRGAVYFRDCSTYVWNYIKNERPHVVDVISKMYLQLRPIRMERYGW